jgi:hypothetical protein
VVMWREVEEDVRRVHQLVAKGKAEAGYAILIDEGGRFRNYVAPQGSEWLKWEGIASPSYETLVLWCAATKPYGTGVSPQQ